MSKKSPFEALTREQLIERLEVEIWGAAKPVLAQELANRVMSLQKINPKGVDLVMWLADASHHSNATAMASWVSRQMDDPYFMQATREAPPQLVLVRRLNKILDKTEAANS